MKTIRVTGKGQIKVHPDMTRITMTLTGMYPEYAETLRRSSEDTEKLKDVLCTFGNSNLPDLVLISPPVVNRIVFAIGIHPACSGDLQQAVFIKHPGKLGFGELVAVFFLSQFSERPFRIPIPRRAGFYAIIMNFPSFFCQQKTLQRREKC